MDTNGINNQIMTKFNYILSGFGHATGKYEVSNSLLEDGASRDKLDGFNPELIKHSKNYQAYLKEHPGATPFEYFVGYKMGFETRYHVTPWPPIKQNQDVAENSLDLLVEAVEKALVDSGLDAEDIDGWIVSTVSPQEQAPGIAATLKTYFTRPDNNTPAMTLTSGCAGFNIALRRSLDYFRSDDKLKNILIANTETMSHFLNHKRDFVYHATFGDAAAAAIISRVEPENGFEGVGVTKNYHDLRMIDFVGVDKDWNLYMDGAAVKRRAVPNLVESSKEVLELQGWTVDDLDLVVPHQTGNAILHSVAEDLTLPLEKLFQETQAKYGNVSGTTIPISLSELHYQGRLKPGMKILCPTAGVGGEYGAWVYQVPEKQRVAPSDLNKRYSFLKGKQVLLIGADNNFGVSLLEQMMHSGANVKIQYNRRNDYTTQLEAMANLENCNAELMVYNIESEVNAIEFVKQLDGKVFDYVINLNLASETIYAYNDINEVLERLQKPMDRLTRELLAFTKETSFILGHPLEEAALSEPSPLASAVAAWHGLAGSMSGEAISKGIRTVWYTPAVYAGITGYMSGKTRMMAMKGMRQEVIRTDLSLLADKVIRSLFYLKVPQTLDKYQGPMIYRRDACAFRK
jgi:3-oxoacyl-[acyl-carrier-protein] synthase-3